jgi:hypothetical protein
MEDRNMRTRRYLIAVLGMLLVPSDWSAGLAQEAQRAKAMAEDVKNALEADGGALRGFSQAELARIVRGFQISPVRLDLRGKDVALVGLGSYLVNAAGGCNDCHTNPPFAAGGDPFAGEPKKVNAARYLAGGTPFGDPTDPDTPFSRNLTPRASSGLPAGLTWQQFRQTMRSGVDLKHRRPFAPSEDNDLLQVMPWPVYQSLTDRDLRAIYEFLRAIPSLPSMP